MSRMTIKDVELEQYWETYYVTKEWYEYEYQWPAFCKKCSWPLNTFSDRERCPHCKAFII